MFVFARVAQYLSSADLTWKAQRVIILNGVKSHRICLCWYSAATPNSFVRTWQIQIAFVFQLLNMDLTYDLYSGAVLFTECEADSIYFSVHEKRTTISHANYHWFLNEGHWTLEGVVPNFLLAASFKLSDNRLKRVPGPCRFISFCLSSLKSLLFLVTRFRYVRNHFIRNLPVDGQKI